MVEYLSGGRIQGSSTKIVAGSALAYNDSAETNVTFVPSDGTGTPKATSTSAGWGNGKAYTVGTWNPNQLASGEKFTLDFSTTDDTKIGFMGLEKDPSGFSGHGYGLDYGFYLVGNGGTANYINCAENSTVVAEFPEENVGSGSDVYSASDVFRITMDSSGTVEYYRQAGGTGSFVAIPEYPDGSPNARTTASGDYYIIFYTYDSGFTTDIESWSDTKAIVDEKTTVTDVPVGSQFEETDTRKFYQYLYPDGFGSAQWTERGTAGSPTEYAPTRGCMGGGGRWSPSSSSSNIIDYITIASTGNAIDFGDLTSSRGGCAGINSTTRGCFAGGMEIAGNTFTNIIDYITILTAGNATDFGDLNDSQWLSGGCSDLSRGLSGGGRNAGYENVIDYFTISTTGNATDFGDLTQGRGGIGAVADSTRGVFAGGYGPSDTNVIDYVTIQTLGDAADFGDLTVARAGASGAASATRGVFAGGAAHTGDTIDYITIQTTGNATDFGNQTESRIWTASCSNGTRGTWAGGEESANNHSEIIDYVTIDTTGNATDFGDLTDSGRIYPSGVSG